MIQMLLFVLFILSPFIVLGIMGIDWGWKAAYTVGGVILILGFGAICGLVFAAVSEPSSYWRSYDMPKLWANQYVNSMTSDDGFYKLLALPYIFMLDLIRLYFDFSIKNGSLKIWIPELITIFAAVKWVRGIWFHPFKGS